MKKGERNGMGKWIEQLREEKAILLPENMQIEPITYFAHMKHSFKNYVELLEKESLDDDIKAEIKENLKDLIRYEREYMKLYHDYNLRYIQKPYTVLKMDEQI